MAETMVGAQQEYVRTCPKRCDKGVHEEVEIVLKCRDVVGGLDVRMCMFMQQTVNCNMFLLLLTGLEHPHSRHWWLKCPSRY